MITDAVRRALAVAALAWPAASVADDDLGELRIYPTHGSTEAALLSYLASQVHAGQERMDRGEAH